MKTLTTFEDIFNKLFKDYRGKEVQISIRKNGLNITSFNTRVDNIFIRQAAKNHRQNSQKTGVILIEHRKNNEHHLTVSIPFYLGFDTMQAFFSEKKAIIRSFDMEFSFQIIRNFSSRSA